MLESWHRGKMQKPGITLSLLVLCLQLSVTGTFCCHPGATEQHKVGNGGGLGASCSSPACPTLGQAGMGVNDASTPGLGIPASTHQLFHVSGFLLSMNPCCKMSFSSTPASAATVLGSLPLAEGQF